MNYSLRIFISFAFTQHELESYLTIDVMKICIPLHMTETPMANNIKADSDEITLLPFLPSTLKITAEYR